ncbi:Hypothetical protein D9617_1g081050 [Elsinoe fawcettii]|nr:Hypothetical protein D9617_1g081050 [Elsinoe fawcettii]
MDHNDYRVAWICPLSKERTAAYSLLDKEYAPLSPRDGDFNIYTFGRMGRHNVVIAHMPSGSTGTGHAARLAVQLKTTFRNIDFSFLVGIGGGAPSDENDIRLGDIVVSHPHKQHAGVIQYDRGKALPNDEIEITGFLNRPSDALLSAVARLRSDHEYRGSQITAILGESVIKESSRFNACLYPGTEHDKLFYPNYTHKNPFDPHCSRCDPTKVIQRPSRDNDNRPVVHYGPIASGDMVIKDGVLREKLRTKYDVLCFEMEAAGLVNDFNCLVIRGICDYADSHKNDRWQEYAAAVAAAYTRELLDVIPSTIPQPRSAQTSPQPQYPAPFEAPPRGTRASTVNSNGSFTQPHYPSSLFPQQPPQQSYSATSLVSGRRSTSPNPSLFKMLGNGPEYLHPSPSKPWQHLKLKSFNIYEKIYESVRGPDDAVSFDSFLSVIPPETSEPYLIWKRLAGNQNSDEINNYRKSFFLAVLYIVHVETAFPEIYLGVDPIRRKMLSKFDFWVECHCKDKCGRQWNFVNERGLCRNEPKDECDLSKLYRNIKTWHNHGKRERWEGMKDEWYRKQVVYYGP